MRALGSRPRPPHPIGLPLDSLLKPMISISIPCYGAPPDTISSGGVLERGLLTQADGALVEALLERVS